MTTFDFTRVREFADNLNGKLDRCDHGEGAECATIETSLALYAECCCSFYNTVCQWARDVFTGRVAFDAAAEQMWRAELERLYARAVKLTELIRQVEQRCYKLDEKCALESALWHLSRLRQHWVTPKLAIAPSARNPLNEEAAAAARQPLASLVPLPADWEPDNPDQRRLFHSIRAHRSKGEDA